MNILIDLIPEEVEINGQIYPINTDFRTSILFELMFEEPGLSEEEIIYNSLDLFFGDNKPEDLDLAIESILWFYTCGRKKEESGGGGDGKSDIKRIYSFEHDAEYIYSAFLTQYGIDLQDIDYLHWWKFRAMFNSLNDDLLFTKIMSFRAKEITSDMSDSEKSYYRKMKRLYALPDNRSPEEKESDFHEAIARLI